MTNILFSPSDNDKKIWSFDLCDYDLVRDSVSCLNPEVTIGALPKFVLNLLKSSLHRNNIFSIIRISIEITNILQKRRKSTSLVFKQLNQKSVHSCSISKNMVSHSPLPIQVGA